MPVPVEFGLLGPLMVRCGGTVLPVRRGGQRAVLATLLLEANRAVPAEALAEVLWGAAAPPSAPATLRNLIRRLRQTLGEAGHERIITQPRGYLIRAADGELDLVRFESLMTAARVAGRDGAWDAVAARTEEALALWRGEPLADIESETLVQREAPRLAELHVQALQMRIDADLRLGRHAEVVVELQDLAAGYPLREQIHALLMLALYRCGRQADALAVFRQVRTVLVEELGAEPGAELAQLHQRILAADPALSLPQPTAVAASGAAGGAGAAGAGTGAAGALTLRVPRQLPATIAGFAGREIELAALAQILDGAGTRAAGTVAISAIGGTAGVGKTALAIHWAHQVAERFEDGQLYLNLRGYGPAGSPPATPAEAIRALLAAFGVPPERIPPGLDAQAGLYRSLLADRRMLIVLDNAHDEQQVRPLLPAGGGCLIIVTSRHQLAGLAASDGARLVSLDVLSPGEATEMLTTRLGAQRAAAEPEAVGEIVRLCARLPLALAVAAARAEARPSFPLATLAAELRDAHGRLDALDAGDPAASVRAVFSWSIQQLSPAAARMFRLLGIHPGPDITASAAASLAGLDPHQARPLLRELSRGHLLTEHTPGRYVCHDLLRAYAADQAHATDSDSDRHEATARLLAHYLHTAHAAALLLKPSREPVTIAASRPGVTPEHLDDYQQALAWFEAEHQVLMAAVSLAAAAGFGVHAWQISWTMTPFLKLRAQWQDQAAIHLTALAAATRLGDTAGQAMSRRFLGDAYARLADYGEARAHLTACLELYRELGDRAGEARAHQSLGWLAVTQGRHDDALSHSEQALHLFQVIAHQAGQAQMLGNIGWCHAQLGDHEQARLFCQQALAMWRQAGNRHDEAHAWDNLGFAEQHLGRHDQAVTSFQHALGTFREFGDRYYEAKTLTRLADSYHAMGEPQQAREARQQALEILDDLGHSDADQVRAKLAGADGRDLRQPAAHGQHAL
jgi:DNA-binding SARP family transcriptional activator